jgi:hypothetical protein
MKQEMYDVSPQYKHNTIFLLSRVYILELCFPIFYTCHLNLFLYIRVITKLPNSEQSNKGKVKTHKYINRQNQRNGGLNQILKRQTSPFHYGSKFPAVTITVFITILEQNR